MIIGIELDEMPTDCYECPLQIKFKDGVQDDWYIRRCTVKHRAIEYPKPEWCPLKEQKEVVHVEKDVTYPADMLTPGDVMASIGFNEQIAGHIGEMFLENGAVRIETLEEYEGPYHMVRFHLSADVIKQRKEGEQE